MACNAGVVFLLVLASASIGVNAQSKPTVSFDRAMVSVTEGTRYCFELQVVGFFNEPFSVDVQLVPASAWHFLDFIVQADPGNLVETVDFTVGFINSTEVCIIMIPNNALEPLEYFLCRISIPDGVNALLGSPSTLRVNILDDDEVRVSFQSSSVVVNEGAGQLYLELTSIGIYTTPFSVTVRCLEVFPAEARLSTVEQDDVDAYPVVFTAHFDQLDQADTLSSRFSISIVDDCVKEPPELFVCFILRPFGTPGIVVADPDNITISIEDNDGGQSVGFSRDQYMVEEGAAVNVTLAVDCPPDCDFNVTLEHSLSDTAAGAGMSDFTAAPYNAVFPAGVNSAVVTVRAIDDNIAEKNETFSLKIVSVNSTCGVKIGTRSSATIIIKDNDTVQVCLNETAISVKEGEQAKVTLAADRPFSCNFTVIVATQYGTAAAGEDFVGGPYSVVFTPGQLTEMVCINTTEDNMFELPENFSAAIKVPLQNDVSVTTGDCNTSVAIVTIYDMITTCSKPFCKRHRGDTICQVPTSTAGAVSGCTGPFDLTTCKACYYSKKPRSHPRQCRLRCMGEVDEDCIRSYGRCVRRRNKKRFGKVSSTLKKAANFKCFRPIC